MLTILGWLNGFTAFCVVFCGCLFGIFFIFKGIKIKAKLLSYAGLMIILTGLLYLGPCVDYFTILSINHNLDNSYGLYGILSYIWITPGIVVMMYIGFELVLPKIRNIVIIMYSFLGLIFLYHILFNTMDTFDFKYPGNSGSDIIDSNFAQGSIAYILIISFVISIIGFNVIGSLIRSFQSSGIIQRKFIFLSLGFLIFAIMGTFDTLFSTGFVLFIVRIIMLSSWWFYFFGLKEAPTKKERRLHERIKNLEKIEFSLLEMLLKDNPPEIVKEQIVYHIENRICLICKSNVGGFNTYLCVKCGVLYCIKCARALSELENLCWVCKNPIDISKPTRKIAIEEIEALEKSLIQKRKSKIKR